MQLQSVIQWIATQQQSLTLTKIIFATESSAIIYLNMTKYCVIINIKSLIIKKQTECFSPQKVLHINQLQNNTLLTTIWYYLNVSIFNLVILYADYCDTIRCNM